ncbi:MAG TPA: YciI family protein [Gaiellaceae bacterium]|nr:YciI family protein [Gaiellaceae bacterium]
MRYLALIYGEEERWDALSAQEQQAEMEDYVALSNEAASVGGAELQPVATATTVRTRGHETQITDGPFADTKEVLGGFYVFECDSIDAACALAARIPAARHGAVEVRPVAGEEAA